LKTRAFYNDGSGNFLPITASQVYQENEMFRGKWNGTRFYPRPFEQFPMHVSKRNNKRFFVFKSEIDRLEYESQGGGESKTHNLVKLALCEIGSTRLRIRGLIPGKIHEEKVTFKGGTDEHREIINGKNYFIDSMCSFDSEGLLSLKWDGRIGIEVFHSHKVPDEKAEALREAGIPVVEFPIPKIDHYWGEEDDCDEQKERRYIEYVKKVLFSENGYMTVDAISNPSSKAYLIKENEVIKKQLHNEKVKVQNLENELANLLEQLRTRRNQNDLLTKKQTDLEKSHKALDSELSKAKKEIKVIREMGFTKMAWLKLLQKL